MSRSRSAPARIARSDTAVIEPVASDARASIESVTTTPRKPSSSRSTPSMIGRDCDAIRAAVERRVARVPDHHERDSGGDRGLERAADRPPRAGHASAGWSRLASSVFAGAAPIPGKCLAVAATPPARQPRTASRNGGAHDRGITREGTRRERRVAHARNVGDRGEGHRDPDRSQLRERQQPRRSAPSRRRPARGAERTGPAQRTRRTRPPSWSTATIGRPLPRRRSAVSAPELRRRVDVAAEEDRRRRPAAPAAPRARTAGRSIPRS